MTDWAVLLTSHERRESTLACLAAVHEQVDHPVELSVYLVDAGSSDGTATAVERAYPGATVLRRGPELFWNGGMRVAFEHAHRRGHDGYLWLNDDTILDPDAISRLARTDRELRGAGAPSIVVGATRDPVSGRVTYSGVRRTDPRRRLHWSRVAPVVAPTPVETMNGNCVLVPTEVAARVGNLDPRFTHGMGDFDYGLRARRAGFAVVLAPGSVGTCAANPRVARGPAEELRHLAGPKGLPLREWLTFARRWAGPLWPLYFASPYLRRVVGARSARRTQEG